MRLTSTTHAVHGKRLLAAIVCGLTLSWVAQAGGAGARAAFPATGQPPDRSASASLVQCVTAAVPTERSATFSGEMTAVAGAARMSMRIEVLERMQGAASFHTVLAPGLGVWRTADPGVKVYKYLKQVTNLAAPAAYRAVVAFRWQGSRGHVIKRAERVTRLCRQPAPAIAPDEPATQAGAPSATG
ncbi:MAG TPA: hypothetical protein VES65_00855 [Solirubrobacteraceae bacterium]|nr:hypothetical protein [Solirubrobacteraceae bacterium]